MLKCHESNSFLSTRLGDKNRLGSLTLITICSQNARETPPPRDAQRSAPTSMLPELNEVRSEEEDDEEEEEDEFQMLERLTREIDGLAAPSSRDYSSSPLREIRAFVGKRNHHIPRGNSGGSGGHPGKKNNTNSNTNNEYGSRSKNEKRLLTSTTTRDEMMRRKSGTNRNQQREERDEATTAQQELLSKYRALKRAFRKLSEDYDYNLALFKERDEELDLLEEHLKIEKMKTTRYRERIRELERELALRETTTS